MQSKSRRARANILAVEERQSLETLNRDLKTCSRTLTQAKEKSGAFEEKRDNLSRDEAEASEKKDEVWIFDPLFA
jgi:structural maintenance of chromosome 1